MSYIAKLIQERALPPLLTNLKGEKIDTTKKFEERKEELKQIIQENIYGFIPKKPDHMRVEVLESTDRFCASKAPLKKLNFIFETDGKTFSFPAYSVIPKTEGKHPAFVHINFRPDVPDKYMPSEEIADRGYACFSFCYEDVTSDDGNFRNKCAPYLCHSRRAKSAPGKIAMWAWAAMRVMDYIQTLDCIDKDNIAVAGHSRLGKTALLTAALDERFSYAMSNDSGCTGAALSRMNTGETVEVITKVFPYWFCPRYTYIAGNGLDRPFDQHFLLSLIVPRHIVIGSAELDDWADPKSEFLCLASVNEAYELYGMKGLVHNDEIPTAKAYLGDGDSCYQIRHGTHYFSREDWCAYMDYMDKYVK